MLTDEEVARYRRELGITPEKVGDQSRRGRTHGLLSTYRNGCRCDPCRGANRDKERGRRRRNGSGRTHGIVSTYVAGCRCGECTEANREAKAAYRARTRRRAS